MRTGRRRRRATPTASPPCNRSRGLALAPCRELSIDSAGIALLGVALLDIALLGVALLDIALLGVALLGIALLGVALLGIALLGVALLGVARVVQLGLIRSLLLQVTCPDGSSGQYRLPSNSTLRLSVERGGMVARLVTPRVASVARDIFNCSSLEGAELENQPTAYGTCWGSHWEQVETRGVRG